jgi:NADPH-dependent 2,4-dienoyl-CoA reductase/sulfur reductase-like enzyme
MEGVMSLIRSLIGRRQFLAAAGITSASALTLGKLGGVVDPVFQESAAMAAGRSGTAGVKMGSGNYSHVLSPLKIRNKVVKNRMLVARGIPHYIQGPEAYPAEELRAYYSRLAQNGAIVNVNINGSGGRQSRIEASGDMAHGSSWDMEDPAVGNYISQMIEGIHIMGSLAAGVSPVGRTVEEIVASAKSLEDQGFDVVTMGERYTDMLDKKNMDMFLKQMQAVRKATDLLIIIWLDIKDPSTPPEAFDFNVKSHYTIEQAVDIAKAYDGTVDIMYFKTSGGAHNHASGFVMEKGDPRVIHASQVIKESGSKIITAPNGGFFEPELNEAFIARGKTDMVAMCRAFISNWEYTEMLSAGRGEDIVPCIKCNKCHGLSMDGPWYNTCSVNPRLGAEPFVRLIKAPAVLKKVAVIGGGPAGMKAAIMAAERGHKVTLYEKNDKLGGLMRQADFSPYSWPIKDFKDYLIRQTEKSGVEVLLRTEATPDMIRKKGYDTVLAAAGAEPVISKMPGADSANVWNFFDVFANEKTLGKDVVFIGGGEFGGVQTGMFLAKAGHNVTVLTSEKELYPNVRVHYPEGIIWAYDLLKNYDYFAEVMVKGISAGKVTYVDAKGKEKSIKADSVVIYAGLRPRNDEALKFYGTARQFITAGDCTERGGNIQKAIRSAYFAASQI